MEVQKEKVHLILLCTFDVIIDCLLREKKYTVPEINNILNVYRYFVLAFSSINIEPIEIKVTNSLEGGATPVSLKEIVTFLFLLCFAYKANASFDEF